MTNRLISLCKAHWRLVILLSFALLALWAAPPAAAQDPKAGDVSSLAVVSLQNDALRADAAMSESAWRGCFTIGTTGGDPASTADDNKPLLYGFLSNARSSPGSSLTTLRMVDGATPTDTLLNNIAVTSGPAVIGNTLVTEWLIQNIRVTQRLALVNNPYTGRLDTVRIAYTLANEGAAAKNVGIRALLDVQIGGNDGAPYFVPGVGNLTREREFLTGSIPSYWRAFESATFDANSLKGQGTLTGNGTVAPDRFVLGEYWKASGTKWDFTVDPNHSFTNDSVVLLYWNPQSLAPGQSRTVITFYGLAGEGGGQTWMDGPASVPCDDLQFSVTQFVVNNTSGVLAGGSTTIQLPNNVILAPGEVPTKYYHDIAVGDARSATWTLIAQPAAAPITVTIAARATFSNYPQSLVASKSVALPFCPTPTPT